MKNQLFLLLIALCVCTKLQAQCDSITFSSQAEIDNFPNLGCTAMTGNVVISGPDIANLDGLLGLASIGGDLVIDSNLVLTSLSGLDSIKTVGGNLWIIDNALLPNLIGIENLASVSGNIDINFNGSLASLAPFKQLKSIAGQVTIWANPLQSLGGLDSLRYAGGMHIWQNEALTNLNGLHRLDSVGEISIRGNLGLTDLTGLGNLRVIQQNMTISGLIFFMPDNSSLTSLQGLDQLVSVGGQLEISHHPLLTNLSGLGALGSIGDLNISFCPLLTDLSSLSVLDSIDTIDGDVIIAQNAALTSLGGLENIVSIGGTLNISANPLLPDLAGLEGLRAVDDLIYVANNENLLTLNGLNGLDSIKGENFVGGGSLTPRGLWILDNPKLVSLQGLENVDFIRDILILNNLVLSDLSALDRHFPITGSLYISENPLLSVCAVQAVCDYLDDPPGVVTIHTNAPGCNFSSEVLAVCKGFSNVIQGTVFWEDQAGCFYDSTEQVLPQWLVKAEGDSLTFYAVTDTAGHFSILVDTGAYTLGVQLPSNLWALCDTIQVFFSDSLQSADTAIGVRTVESCPLMNVDIAVPFLRRCFENFYTVGWVNEGTDTAFGARVEIRLDTLLDVNTTSLPNPWMDLGGNAYSIALGDVAPLARGSFTVGVTPNCAGTQNGQAKCVEARIFPNVLCIPPDGWDESDLVVRAFCLGDSVLFLIRNVGNGDMTQPAEYIIIEDVVLGIYEEGAFQLAAGQDTVITIPAPANGGLLRMQVQQSPGHPFSEFAMASVEACPDFVSPTFFLQYPQDESSPFVAVDCHPLIGSWDPNDKQAFPQGLGPAHNILNDTEIEYLVHFQNTGTDTAFHVVIRDTLSPSLDVATVRLGAASRPCRFEIVSGNALKFIFDDILLPDSTTNEPASHGFVQFSVRQKSAPVNPSETLIENRAAIYFDYNAPVLTNTVFHTVAGPLASVFRDTVCDPAAGDLLLTDTARYDYYEVIHETLLSDTVYATLDTFVCLGDTIFNVVVLGPVTIIVSLTSTNGCDSILTALVDTLPAALCVVSTKMPSDAPAFQLSPNPTMGDLTLVFPPTAAPWKNATLEIRHASGRLCLSRQLSLPGSGIKMTLPVSELPAGAYFVVLRGPADIWSRRFAKLN